MTLKRSVIGKTNLQLARLYLNSWSLFRGKYHCVATNKFGSVVSESVQLSFGFIGEFNLKRSSENGLEHWGKAIYCDPPQYFPDIQYYWVIISFRHYCVTL